MWLCTTPEGQNVRPVLGGCWSLPESVHNFKSFGVEHSVRWPQDLVPAFCRWYGSFGFISSTSTGLLCCLVWNGWDENQHIHVWDHGYQLEEDGVLTTGREGVASLSGGVLSISRSCSWVRGEWSRRLTDRLVRCLQRCGCFISLLW